MGDKIWDLTNPDDQRFFAEQRALQNSPTPPEAVPVWVGRRSGGAKAKYPLATMELYGTFFVEVGPDQPKWESFRVYCSNRGTALGRKFRCHKHPDGRYEVWRER